MARRHEFTTDRWQPGQCWFNYGNPSGPFCPRAGVYGNPKAYDAQNRKYRWCETHKGPKDKRCALAD